MEAEHLNELEKFENTFQNLTYIIEKIDIIQSIMADKLGLSLKDLATF